MKEIDQSKPCHFCEHHKAQLVKKTSSHFGFSWNLEVSTCSMYKYPPDKNGIVELKYCDIVRQNEALCGPKGKDFEPTAYSNLKRLMRGPESGQ